MRVTPEYITRIHSHNTRKPTRTAKVAKGRKSDGVASGWDNEPLGEKRAVQGSVSSVTTIILRIRNVSLCPPVKRDAFETCNVINAVSVPEIPSRLRALQFPLDRRCKNGSVAGRRLSVVAERK